jgi:hypothetical protein
MCIDFAEPEGLAAAFCCRKTQADEMRVEDSSLGMFQATQACEFA